MTASPGAMGNALPRQSGRVAVVFHVRVPYAPHVVLAASSGERTRTRQSRARGSTAGPRGSGDPQAWALGRLPRGMERDSRRATAALHGCRSALGGGCATVDAWSSSRTSALPESLGTPASVGQRAWCPARDPGAEQWLPRRRRLAAPSASLRQPRALERRQMAGCTRSRGAYASNVAESAERRSVGRPSRNAVTRPRRRAR
jgi:hypothetical protein